MLTKVRKMTARKSVNEKNLVKYDALVWEKWKFDQILDVLIIDKSKKIIKMSGEQYSRKNKRVNFVKKFDCD